MHPYIKFVLDLFHSVFTDYVFIRLNKNCITADTQPSRLNDLTIVRAAVYSVILTVEMIDHDKEL